MRLLSPRAHQSDERILDDFVDFLETFIDTDHAVLKQQPDNPISFHGLPFGDVQLEAIEREIIKCLEQLEAEMTAVYPSNGSEPMDVGKESMGLQTKIGTSSVVRCHEFDTTSPTRRPRGKLIVKPLRSISHHKPMDVRTDDKLPSSAVRHEIVSTASPQTSGESIHKLPGNNTRTKTELPSWVRRQPKQGKSIVIKSSRYECAVCKKTFGTSIKLKGHMRLVCKLVVQPRQQTKARATKAKHFECFLCRKQYSWLVTLKEHMKIHSDGERNKCYVCGVTYGFRTNLLAHMRREHAGASRYQCSRCKKWFRQRSTLKSHRLAHIVRRGSSQVSSRSRVGQATHKKTMIPKEPRRRKPAGRKAECVDCGLQHARDSRHLCKRQSQDSRVSAHTEDSRTAAAVAKFTCEFCAKSFKHKYRLNDHRYSHSEKRLFPCEFCGLRFKHKRNLKPHISRLHSQSFGD